MVSIRWYLGVSQRVVGGCWRRIGIQVDSTPSVSTKRYQVDHSILKFSSNSFAVEEFILSSHNMDT